MLPQRASSLRGRTLQKLTKRLIESLSPKLIDYFIWDREVNGFAVRVLPSGNKTFQVQYRQGGRTRRKSLGRVGTVSLDLARSHAREILGRVGRCCIDPAWFDNEAFRSE
jgi:hypothetical protein